METKKREGGWMVEKEARVCKREMDVDLFFFKIQKKK